MSKKFAGAVLVLLFLSAHLAYGKGEETPSPSYCNSDEDCHVISYMDCCGREKTTCVNRSPLSEELFQKTIFEQCKDKKGCDADDGPKNLPVCSCVRYKCVAIWDTAP